MKANRFKFRVWDKENKRWFKSDGDFWVNLMPDGTLVSGDDSDVHESSYGISKVRHI